MFQDMSVSRDLNTKFRDSSDRKRELLGIVDPTSTLLTLSFRNLLMQLSLAYKSSVQDLGLFHLVLNSVSLQR